MKIEEMLYFTRKEGLLFNHLITKSLRDGISNLFSLKRYSKDLCLCPVTGIEPYIAICDVMYVMVSCLDPSLPRDLSSHFRLTRQQCKCG